MGWGFSGQCAFSLLLPGACREVFSATAQPSTPLSSKSELLFAVISLNHLSNLKPALCLPHPSSLVSHLLCVLSLGPAGPGRAQTGS